MEWILTTEQEAFRDMIRRFLAETAPSTVVRQCMATDTGVDETHWQRVSSELGLPGLLIEEQFGGSGFSLADAALVMRELGYGIYCGPYFSSAIVATLLLQLAANRPTQQKWLPQLADGSRRATLAAATTQPNPGAMALPVVSHGGRTQISGHCPYVLDAGTCSIFLIIGRDSDNNLGLYTISADAAGIEVSLRDVIDPTRKISSVTFTEADVELVSTLSDAAQPLQKALDSAAIALANEMLGGTERLFEDTLAYLRMRVQFGRNIASFQAIKHRCAELLLGVEMARSAVLYAAGNEDESELTYLASLAQSTASDTYIQTAREAIQLHGGIGFTEEQDTHLWFKRAKSQ